jgi:uncharacterized SAM-binding protein YcdF (DUF218 family)
MDNKAEKQPADRRKACCSVWVWVWIGLVPILLYLLLSLAGGILIVGDPLRKSDVVVLLGGGDQQRLEEAVQIYQDKDAGLIVLTNTGEVDPRFGIPYTTLQTDAAVALGVPTGGIVYTDSHGNSTYEEAVAVRKLLTQSGRVTSAIIVTDPYHTLRTRLIYRDVFKDTNILVSIRPVRNHWYKTTTWWHSRLGWETTLTEYAKLFAYFMGVHKGP